MSTSLTETLTKFRTSFKIAKEAIQWYPGHMHKSFQIMQAKLTSVDCIFEVHDARIPMTGRNPNFVKKLIGEKPHILILSKKDLILKSYAKLIRSKLQEEENIENLLFINNKDQKCEGLRKIVPLAVNLISNSNRFNRSTETNLRIMVIGVPNTGKSSLINALRSKNLKKGRATPVGGIAGITKAVHNEIKIHVEPPVYVLDTPGILPPNIKDTETGMKLALCSCLNDENIGIINIADFMLYWFNKNNCFNYVDVLGLNGPSDDILPILVKIANDENKFETKLNIATHAYEKLPDIRFAASRIVKMFREGKFGNLILDTDILSSEGFH